MIMIVQTPLTPYYKPLILRQCKPNIYTNSSYALPVFISEVKLCRKSTLEIQKRYGCLKDLYVQLTALFNIE